MRVPDAPPTTPLDALRLAAVERPDDEQTHLVYADALLAAGDPLGELIVAQCRDPTRVPNEEELARAAGPLYRAGAAFGVRRGILRTILLKRVTPTQLRRLVGKAAWESVFAIEFGRGRRTRAWPTEPLVDLVTHPVCRRLTQLYFLPLEGLARLLPVDRCFELVHVDVNDETQYPDLAETSVQLKIRELVMPPPACAASTCQWTFAGKDRPSTRCTSTCSDAAPSLKRSWPRSPSWGSQGPPAHTASGYFWIVAGFTSIVFSWKSAGVSMISARRF